MDETAGTLLRVRELDVWYGRVQVLFGLDLDVAPRRDRRRARHQRRGQDHAAARHQRSGRAGRRFDRTGRRRPDPDERGGSRPSRVGAGARRRRVPRPDRRREPARGPRRSPRAPTGCGAADRACLRRVPRARGAPPAGHRVALGRRAADGGAGIRAPVRARVVAGRRAVARVGAPRRATSGRRPPRTARRGSGHGRRRTIADRGGAIGGTGRVPREGHRSVRRSRGRAHRARRVRAAIYLGGDS